MADEQTVAAPTDEMVMEAVSGEQTSAPAETGESQEQTAPEQSQAAQPSGGFDEAKLQALLDKVLMEKLNPIQSELGQVRKFRSEWSKAQNGQQKQVPQSWQALPEDQQKAFREMMRHAWEQEFGDDWQAIQQERQQAQQFQQVRNIDQTAREYAGAEYDKLDPILGSLLTDLKAKAQSGDQRAARFVQEVYSTESGVLRLVDLAKQEYAKTIQSKQAEATNKQAQVRKSAATALGNTNQPPSDPSGELAKIMKISDPTKRFEAAKAYWKERGEIE